MVAISRDDGGVILLFPAGTPFQKNADPGNAGDTWKKNTGERDEVMRRWSDGKCRNRWREQESEFSPSLLCFGSHRRGDAGLVPKEEDESSWCFFAWGKSAEFLWRIAEGFLKFFIFFSHHNATWSEIIIYCAEYVLFLTRSFPFHDNCCQIS